jgi:conjugative transfer signal peptidase TraF
VRSSFLAYSCWGIAALLWGAVHVADAAGLRINHTPSLPMGLWRVTPVERPLERGQIVSFCPPDRAPVRQARERRSIGSGRCSGGYEPLLKRIEALPGDRVRSDIAGLAVNGIRLARRPRLEVDHPAGRIIGARLGTTLLGPGEYWVGTAHPRSFDSRHFGPVPASHVIGTAVLLFAL